MVRYSARYRKAVSVGHWCFPKSYHLAIVIDYLQSTNAPASLVSSCYAVMLTKEYCVSQKHSFASEIFSHSTFDAGSMS